MSNSEEKPIFILRMSRLKPLAKNVIIWIIAFSVFSIILPDAYSWLIFGILIVVLALVQFFGLKSLSNWRMEFYDNHYKLFYRGEFLQDTNYNEIARIEVKRRLYRKYPYLYGKDNNKLLVVLPSNPKPKELSGLTVLDWLKSRISQIANT